MGRVLAICYSLFFGGCVFCMGFNLFTHWCLSSDSNKLLHFSPEMEENISDVESNNSAEDKTESNSYEDKKKFCMMGMSSFLALTLHNFPEGVAIVLPVYYATRSRLKAVLYVGVASIAEPI